MTAITITDLNNAKLDVDHIAEMSTSLAATCVDRMGNVKQTMSAASNAVAATSAGQSTSAKVAAEAARDAAIIGSGVYVNEPTGRAAVADGAAFKVQGTGDVAAYEYRRVNAGTVSTLIATYPSIASLENTLENFNGVTQSLIGSDHAVALARGTYTFAGVSLAGTIFGWSSAFFHNGSSFSVIQTTLRAGMAGRMRIEICRGSAPLVPIAYGFAEVTTVARLTTIVLNRTVRDVANNEVMYIRIYDPRKVVSLAYGVNIRTGSDPDATTYPDQYWHAGGWTTASPAPNYRIDFKLFNVNLERRVVADDIKTIVGVGSATALLPNLLASSPVFTRGNYEIGNAVIVPTIFGWRSPFKHNGLAFNAVQFSLKDGGTSAFPINVEILSSDGVTVLGFGVVVISGGSTVGTYTVSLNRLVTELALNSIGYIQYYDPTKTFGLGYPAGGAYVSDADPATYIEKGYVATGWSTVTPVGSYRINFRAFNTLTAPGAADGAVVRAGVDGAIQNGFMPYFSHVPPEGLGELDGNNGYSYPGALGTYELATHDYYATALDWRVWRDSLAATVEWRVYVRDTTVVFNMDSTPRVAEGTIANFPTVDGIYRLELGTRIKVLKGQYLYVIVRGVKADTTDGSMYIGRWDVAGTGRHGLIVNVSGQGWNRTFGNGAYPAYAASALRFINESEERQSAVTSAAQVEFVPTADVASTDVQAAIAALGAAVEIITTDIVLPATVFGLEGAETNIYFDNLVLDAAANYDVSAIHTAASGVHQDDRWTWTPTGAVTTGSLTISLNNKRSGDQIVADTINTRAAASSAGTGLTKKVIVVGDSLIGAGVVTQTLLDVAAVDAMSITLYGTEGTGANLHEGRGGWGVYDYTGAGRTGEVPPNPNPFWVGGLIDFPAYLAANSIPVPDWVFISLGINDCAGQVTDAGAISNANARLAALSTLIESIKTADPSTKVGLMLPTPPSAHQDSFGANYGAGSLSRWRFKRSILLWVQRVLAIYAGQEASRIYIVPANMNLDTVYNMATATGVANARNATSVVRQSNGVHPATSGYQQMADAVWAFMKYYA